MDYDLIEVDKSDDELADELGVTSADALDDFAQKMATRAGNKLYGELKGFDPMLLMILFEAIVQFLTACQPESVESRVKRMQGKPLRQSRMRRYVMRKNPEMTSQEAQALITASVEMKEEDWEVVRGIKK